MHSDTNVGTRNEVKHTRFVILVCFLWLINTMTQCNLGRNELDLDTLITAPCEGKL